MKPSTSPRLSTRAKTTDTVRQRRRTRRKVMMRRWDRARRKGKRRVVTILTRVKKSTRNDPIRRPRSILRRTRSCPGLFGKGRWLRDGSGPTEIAKTRRGS